ncbi:MULTISPECIES: zinc ribbon domain-containing protein [Rothia]|uniref:Zinc ribbon domain-containing protein n=1 Tax=Rothia kristinae TaxID=37923 RepID=A0A7T3CHR0_9MICC|nr:zinc ribbon domain-containing protein [Rothia kristinae]TDP51426.1 hypothetical protein DEU33_2094 [Kocuria sp. AG109]SIM63011.1 Uncharacterised protein [Mycobacteroides abscessus subsp. abscessus]KTR39558.1 hypothetical protein RSA5_02165 [Rothia kristinae]KTR58188.1 hypothetical protein SA11R_06075 [Rothia kristinae]KTR63463.1 hypothetical protein SA12R_08500 [Rothia kristinae]
MILHDFLCEAQHRFEAGLPTMDAPNPPCPICGAAARKRLSSVNIGNRADAGPSREQMPHSWEGAGRGDPDVLHHWRKTIERREKLEEKYPELAGDRRPVLAHEGIFAGRPLRAGDDVGQAIGDALASRATPPRKDSP